MFKQFLREEEGQTTVEYLLIIAVVVVVISVLGRNMSKQVEKLTAQVFDGMSGKVNQLMKSAMGN